MYLYFALGFLSLVLISLFRRYQALRRNIAIAEASGLPYVAIPFFHVGFYWHILQRIFLPIAECIPYVKEWRAVRVMWTFHSWRYLRRTYDEIGDSFLIVSPTEFMFANSNAEINAQMAARRADFRKPVEDYDIVKIYGESMLTQEGQDWRRHRKIVGPAFSEKSNALVFEESVRQTLAMLEVWSKEDGNTVDQMFVKDTAPSFAVLALHVICGAGFGVPQTWPGQNESVLGDKIVPGFNTEKLTNNHDLTFKHSLEDVIGPGIIWFALLGKRFVERSAFKIHKDLMHSHHELGRYFNELYEWKKSKLEHGEKDESGTMDLLAPLIKASENGPGMTNGKSDEKTMNQSGALSKDEVIGNAFIFMFAGHETSANTLHYCSTYLAINRSSQAHLQSDIDRILGTRPPSEWTYTKDMRNLYNSMVGAVQNEVLRLTPPVINVPKRTHSSVPQTLHVDGKTVTVPPYTYIHMNVVGTGRNPRYYPHSPSKITNAPHDMDDFVPERWLQSQESGEIKEEVDGLEVASFEAEGSLFRPEKGAFMPFSEGARACPGRRFAQVEITAVLSVLYQSYSAELDCREWASDEEVRRMSLAERQIVYEKAKAKARHVVRHSETIVTLKMQAGLTPLRFVKRGQELFAGC